jgi:AAA domain-containing protein
MAGYQDSVFCATPRVHSIQHFQPRLLSDIVNDPTLQGPEADWILPGYLARGVVTLIAGHPKVGKTTFVAHMAHAVARGGLFLDRSTTPTPVLWLDLEQHARPHPFALS